MNNGWTGGQYSLYRAALGVGVAALFIGMVRQLTPLQLGGLLPTPVVVIFCALFAIGLWDRWMALALAVNSCAVCVKVPEPFVANWVVIGGLMVAHLFMPAEPYGSWSARGRTDPGADWRMPPYFYAAAWFVLALCYGYRGITTLRNPPFGFDLAMANTYRLYVWAGLAFPFLALFRPLRLSVWLMLLMLQIVIPSGLEPMAFGLLLLHGLTFDPAWIKGEGNGVEPIFYDGHCGLCHRAVRFVLAEDVNGAAFRFAPLDSDAFRAAVSEGERAKLPDSMVVKTADGTVLTRSTAFLHILRRLGGLWRVIALFGGLVPALLRDAAYNGVARIRRRLFAAPSDACPVLPKELRQRFDY